VTRKTSVTTEGELMMDSRQACVSLEPSNSANTGLPGDPDYSFDVKAIQPAGTFDGRIHNDVHLPAPMELAHRELISETRRLQDAVMAADAPLESLLTATQSIRGAAKVLEAHHVDWRASIAGMQMHLPGRGQTLSPPIYIDEMDKVHLRAHWSFTRFYTGGGGAVHGGAIPLVADELCGRFAEYVHGQRARTAYIKVDYRKVTPVDREVGLEARVERHQGRKLFVRASIVDGDDLLCEVEGLFISLLPGQP
jgi:acyl-coenzyme A thioesterase PaaI-like protein